MFFLMHRNTYKKCTYYYIWLLRVHAIDSGPLGGSPTGAGLSDNTDGTLGHLLGIRPRYHGLSRLCPTVYRHSTNRP